MASLIEEFLYRWVGDTSSLEAGEKRSEKAVKNANDALSAQDKISANLTERISGLAKGIAGVVGAYASLAAVKGAAIMQAESTVALADQARQLRVNADELDTWKRTVTAAGYDAGGLVNTLSSLKDRTRDPLMALENIADRFKNLNDRQADLLGQQLGIDPGTVAIMRQGKAGLIDLVREQQRYGEVTKEQIETAQKWKAAQTNLNHVFDDVRRVIMQWVLPSITWFNTALKNTVLWMRDNSTFVTAFFGTMATVITALLIPALVRLGVAVLANPLFLMAAAFVVISAAIGLVIDDLIAFRNGADSMFGLLVKKFPELEPYIKALADMVVYLGDIFGAVFGAIGDWLTSPVSLIDALGARLGALLDGFAGKFPGLQAALTEFQGVFDAVFQFIENGIAVVSIAIDKLGGALRGIGEALGIVEKKQAAVGTVYGSQAANAIPGADNVAATVAAGRGVVQAAASNPLAATTSSAINNSRTVSKNTNVTTGPITVEAKSADAKEVASELGKGLNDQIKSAVNEFDNGIAI